MDRLKDEHEERNGRVLSELEVMEKAMKSQEESANEVQKTLLQTQETLKQERNTSLLLKNELVEVKGLHSKREQELMSKLQKLKEGVKEQLNAFNLKSELVFMRKQFTSEISAANDSLSNCFSQVSVKLSEHELQLNKETEAKIEATKQSLG